MNKTELMYEARLKKALGKEYIFSTGWMSLQKYIDSHELTEKITHIRNHSKKKIQGEYKKTKDNYSYSIFWGDEGIDVPKIVYDFYALHEHISDNRFDY